MKTVYLLYESDGESYDVVGVFSTEKLSEDRKDELEKQDCGYTHRYVDEVEMDKIFYGH